MFGRIGGLDIDQNTLSKLPKKLEKQPKISINWATVTCHYRGGSLKKDEWELGIHRDAPQLWCPIRLLFCPLA